MLGDKKMASNHVAFVTAGGLTNATIAHSLYGVCSTAAATAAKAVTMYKTGKTAGAAWAAGDLVDGLTITVRFTNENTAASPTLNVNSTGAKPIYSQGSITDAKWPAQSIIQFTYDTALNSNGYWVLNGSIGKAGDPVDVIATVSAPTASKNVVSSVSTGTGVTAVTTSAQTVVTGVTTAAQTVVTGGSTTTAVYATVSDDNLTLTTVTPYSSLTTASIGKTTAVSTASINKVTAVSTGTVVTAVSTAAQTMVTGVTTTTTSVIGNG